MIDIEVALVSILCITYNHEQYIAQAIDGFLLQDANFNIEIIIHDDASTDGTATIIKKYQEKHPNIKAILQTENQYSKKDGSLENTIFNACNGKYIAFCEGDDFWVDPFKLQKQVDFLELNPDYVLVHHDANYYFQQKGQLLLNHHRTNHTQISDGYVYPELIRNNNVFTPTVVFRTNLIRYYLEIDINIRSTFLMGDYVMWLTFSQYGNFHYIPESMATYRVLQNSASKSTVYEKSLAFMKSYFDIRLFFLNKYPIASISKNQVEQWRLSMYISTAIKYRKNKEAILFAKHLKVNDWRGFLKKTLVYVPPIFRYIQLKNKL